MENKKRTAVLPIKPASIKLFTSNEEVYKSAKESPPSIRKVYINSLRRDIAEKSASKFFLAWLISAIAVSWIGEFYGNDLLWSIGAFTGLTLAAAVILGMILSMANVKLNKFYVSTFAKFPGNRKTKFYIRELEKLES